MSGSVETLFKPFHAANLDVDNRIVMAPMTRQFSPEGVPGEDVAGYYRRRAEGAVGLIITEGTTVNDPVATMSASIPQIHGDKPLAGWQKVVDEVHAAGGKIAPQLWHTGMARNPKDAPHPELPSASPSGILKPGKQVAEPMTVDHIESVIKAFADAAADSKRIGFDAIELHGAHGYLIDQFFWNGMNERNDDFGGDLVKRTKFAVEIIKACRAAVGPDFPIILRFSQWKQQDYTARLAQNPAELEQFLIPLADAGVDIFHCSQRRYWEPEFEGSDLNLAGWTKKITSKPTITVGSVGLTGEFIAAWGGEESQPRQIDDLLERLEREEFDLVGVGRALLQDPNWAVKIRDSRHGELQNYDAASALASLS